MVDPVKERIGKVISQRIVLITVLVILLISVTVVVIRMIDRAPAAGAAGVAGPGGPMEGGGPPPASVYTRSIVRVATQEEVVVTGNLRAVSRAAVAARESGAVREVLVDEGSEVRQGDVIARLDDRRLKAQLEEARARLTSSRSLLGQREAELRRATEDLEMKRRLRERNAVSQSDVLDAEKTLTVAGSIRDAAENSIRESEARLEFLQVQMDDLAITAPFDGAVVERLVEPGEWVAAGEVVAALVMMDPIEAWLRVPARHLFGTESGAENFRVRQSSTGKMFEPVRIDRVSEVEPLSQLFVVVATLPNPVRNLVPGESVTGVVPVGVRQDYWRIPMDAVVQSRTGEMIYAVDAASGPGALPSARAVPIQIAFERDGSAFVPANAVSLTDDARVVVEGNERLMPGQPLIVQPAGTEPGPPAR